MKLKTTILTALLVAFASIAFSQQVKYDSAVISYYVPRQRLYVSLNGKELPQDSASLPRQGDITESLNPIIRKIHEFENLGWICIDIKAVPSETGNKAYVAYLRKKKE